MEFRDMRYVTAKKVSAEYTWLFSPYQRQTHLAPRLPPYTKPVQQIKYAERTRSAWYFLNDVSASSKSIVKKKKVR